MRAWKAWAEKHHDAIVGMGGPLGKTGSGRAHGIEATSNHLSAYTVVHAGFTRGCREALSEPPHFMIFPGNSIEIMPILPIPGSLRYQTQG